MSKKPKAININNVLESKSGLNSELISGLRKYLTNRMIFDIDNDLRSVVSKSFDRDLQTNIFRAIKMDLDPNFCYEEENWDD